MRAFVQSISVALALLCVSHGVSAQWIDRRVTVQPIAVRSTDGQIAANPELRIYEAETDKIWAQAGIDFRFLPMAYYDNSAYLNVSSDIFAANSVHSLALDSGHKQHSDPLVINVYFVLTIDGSGSASGFSLQSTTNYYGTPIERNGVCIANSAFSYAGGLGMRDIFAYEIGRNLGLDNDTLGAPTDPKNLMKTSGPYPTGIDSIHPDGAAYGHLTQEQAAMARRFTFAASLPPEEQYSYSVPDMEVPALKVEILAGQLVVSWPDPSSGFQLQQANSMSPASSGDVWQEVTQTISLVNGRRQISFELSPGARFFRLKKP